ncbi:MAG: DNA mismatch repair protein MutS, partial [Chloroflexi bacterium]|nr:DNA mismatch repair protein MutS [Chloroflexota bacterium]
MPKGRQLSPGRRQYLELKRRYPDVLLLVRMGDFYETFDEDARTMARVLDIALTARDVGGGGRSPLAGIPYRSLESYLGRLIGAGLRVAVCEQTSDPATSKGIVDRAVVRVVTPGTVMEPGLLDQARNNYLAAAVSDGTRAGLAYVDISTSDFAAGEMALDALVDELERLGPSELLADPRVQERLGDDVPGGRVVRALDESRLDAELAEEALKRYFGVATLEPYGCEGRPLAVTAAAAVIEYLSETQPGVAPRTGPLRTFSVDSYVRVDRRVARDLELFEPMGGRDGAPTLLSTLDRTKTAMGGRLLRAWLARPLAEVDALRVRQDGVERFVEDGSGRAAVRDALGRVPDLERLTNRVRSHLATPRDLVGLARGLGQIPAVQAALAGQGSAGSQGPGAGLSAVREAVDLITAAIAEDAPAVVGEGDAIRQGFDEELDETRSLGREARAHIARIESEAREQTGIKSLKVGYNKVFGYYIEVSRPNLHLVPSEFERRQTLVNGERFVTPELKELEARILTARERIGEMERSIFRRVCGEVAEQGERIMASARALGEIDSLAGLAEVAAENGYVRPELNDGDAIDIVAGRHPVVEAALGPGRFVPNDARLSSGSEQILIVTGPNMSGKSTYIRQVALLVLMAQVGSFIPAERAAIGVVDRIFTRAG